MLPIFSSLRYNQRVHKGERSRNLAYPLLEENIGRFVSVNGTIVESQGLAGLSLLSPVEEEAVYEVVRVMDGVPLFWEDHQARLTTSLASAGLPPVDPKSLAREAGALLAALSLTDGNLRIVVTETGRVLHRRRHFYPPEETYSSGVPVGTMAWDRILPGQKAVRSDFKIAVAEKLSQEGPFGRYFETLLVSSSGKVTEGSRSNVFFLDHRTKTLRTAPDADILLGVTRRHVLEAVRRVGLAVHFESVAAVDVISGLYKSIFLTGTSIGVLPVSSVEEAALDSTQEDSIARIRTEYDRLVHEYIQEHRGGLIP
jgi:branched-chain amino acid aminotransferase